MFISMLFTTQHSIQHYSQRFSSLLPYTARLLSSIIGSYARLTAPFLYVLRGRRYLM